MTATAITAPPVVPAGCLERIHPLAKIAGILPAMALMMFVRDIATPVAIVLGAYAVILTGVRMTGRLLLVLCAVIPAGTLIVGLSFALWSDPSLVSDTRPIIVAPGWTLYTGALGVGIATSSRIAAVIALAMIAGLSTTGRDLTAALIQQCRLPYRVGYAALAAVHFVPTLQRELTLIRRAHRVRGSASRAPWHALGRWIGYIVPLLAAAIRHAERVALAMDARAFGAYPQRTNRDPLRFRRRDAAFTAALLAGTAAVATWFFPWLPTT